VTDSEFDADNVDDLGGGTDINPEGPYDLGVEIGTSGIGGDDIQTTIFNLIDSSGQLNVAHFLAQEVAIRASSTGLPGSSRTGSSKVNETVPDEPDFEHDVPDAGTTTLLLGAGLVDIEGLRRKVIKQ
jgi:hypothetical protein